MKYDTLTKTNHEQKGELMLINDRSLRVAVWIIAVSLAAIALRPIVAIKDAQAQSSVEKFLNLGQEKQAKVGQSSEKLGASAESGNIVPFASQGGGVFWAYDRKTLAVYVYDSKDGHGYYLGKISQLGKPMEQAGVGTIPFLR